MSADVIRRAASLAQQFDRDGVILLRSALSDEELDRIRGVFDYGRSHPGPGAQVVYPDSGATFYIDTFNMPNWPAYRPAFEDTVVPDIVGALWGEQDIWFFYEQLFLKEGGDARRTPWHQDASYLPVAGDDVAVVWINFDSLRREESLEFVRGSHRGPTFNTSRFEPEDDSLPIFENDARPRLPNIEGDRDHWDIVSWAVQPGDVIIFNAAILHGGAPTRAGHRRRTVSLRYFGSDAVYSPAPVIANDSDTDAERIGLDAITRGLKPGDPFRNPSFYKVRPRLPA
jgi:hypothetical protein